MILFIREPDRINFMILNVLHPANKNLCITERAIQIVFILFVYESLGTFNAPKIKKIHALHKSMDS